MEMTEEDTRAIKRIKELGPWGMEACGNVSGHTFWFEIHPDSCCVLNKEDATLIGDFFARRFGIPINREEAL